MRLLSRLLVASPLVLAASTLPAQSFLGTDATQFTTGVTLRGRNLQNTNPNGNDAVYIASSASALGDGALRDSYRGSWNYGASPAGTLGFTVSYSMSANTLTFTLNQYANGSANANVAAVATSLAGGNAFTVANVGPFDAFRLVTRPSATIGALTFNGGAIAGLPGSTSDAVPLFISASSAADWTIAGTMNVAVSGTSVEGNRFEVGVASTVTPEPGTYVLLGTGLAGLAAVARRRRRA